MTKRQLMVSPFASPVLKHPCTSRSDYFIDPELVSHDNCCYGIITEKLAEEESEDVSSQELAEPLSLDDLRTETLDLTNITATSCTGFFTNLGIDDHSQIPMETQGHAHLQRVDIMTQPKAHSTMVDSQLKLNYGNLNSNSNLSQQTPAWLSAIPVVSHSNTVGTDYSSSAIPPMSHSSDIDSGVSVSVECHQSDNLSNSRLEGGSNKCLTSPYEGRVAIATVGKNHGIDTLRTPTHRQKLGSVVDSKVRSETVDSGLVFSPDTPLDRGWSNRGVALHQNHTPFAVLRGSQNHFMPQSVLPSRLRVPSTTSCSLLPRSNHSPGRFTLHSPVAHTLQDTPPSRYTKFGGVAPCHVTPVSVFPEEVLRKKRALKACLQFNCEFVVLIQQLYNRCISLCCTTQVSIYLFTGLLIKE